VIAASFEKAKQHLPRTSTERGMQMDGSKQYSKHDSSMCNNFDSLSKVIEKIRLGWPKLPAKQDWPRASTERGMQIDCSTQH
jgi:hypothetical protein